VYVPFPMLGVAKPYTPSIGKGTYTTSTGTAPAHLHYVHHIN